MELQVPRYAGALLLLHLALAALAVCSGSAASASNTTGTAVGELSTSRKKLGVKPAKPPVELSVSCSSILRNSLERRW